MCYYSKVLSMPRYFVSLFISIRCLTMAMGAMMIEVLFSTAVSAALFASAAIPILTSRSRRAEERNKNRRVLTVEDRVVEGMVRNGRAYMVDLGDSTVVVVVLRKSEDVSKSFLEVEEDSINVMNIGFAELAEAGT